MSDYVLGTDVFLDLEDVLDYIADDSVDAADRWIAKLFDAFETLAESPRIAIGARISRIFRFCSGPWELT